MVWAVCWVVICRLVVWGNCWCLLLGGFWVCFAYDFAVVLGDVWFWFVLILIGLVGFGVWLWLFLVCVVLCAVAVVFVLVFEWGGCLLIVLDR